MARTISETRLNVAIKTTLRIILAGWSFDLQKHRLRPSELARALKFCIDNGYLLVEQERYKLTESGLAWLKQQSPDPSFIWLDMPERMLVAKTRRDALSSLGRRARGAIRRRVSDHATKVANLRDS